MNYLLNIENVKTLNDAWIIFDERVNNNDQTITNDEITCILQKSTLYLEEAFNRNPENITKRIINLVTDIDDHMNSSLKKLDTKSYFSFLWGNKTDKNVETLKGLHNDINQLINDIQNEKKILTLYHSTTNPKSLHTLGNNYLKLYQQKELKAEFYSHWGIKFIEKAASLYEKQGDIIKANELRLSISDLEILGHDNPMNQMNFLVNEHPIVVDHAILGHLEYGVPFHRMDGHKIKGENIRVRNIKIDGVDKVMVNFKVSYFESDNIRNTLLNLIDKNLQAMLISKKICNEVTVEGGVFTYYKKEGDSFVTGDNNAWKMGKCIIVNLHGLGKIEIGCDPAYGSMYNKVNITMEKDASEKDLQKILSVMGLTSALCRATPDDYNRLKMNSLIHFLYPREAAKYDRELWYHELPLDQVLDRLEKETNLKGMKKDLLNTIPLVQTHTLATGETRFKMSNLSPVIEEMGGRGFISGISGSDMLSAAKCTACVLKSGFISSQGRFDHGLLLGGASSEDDHKRNSADSIYARAITQSAIETHKDITHIPFHGAIQIILKNEAVELMPYFHENDCYGCRNPKDEQYGIDYLNRPNVYEHYENNSSKWNVLNEVMFKNNLDPSYIAGIIYQDPRRELSSMIMERNPAFFPENLISAEEKMEYITGNPELVENELAKYPEYFISSSGAATFYGNSIAEHWVLNPKETIKSELEKVGIHGMFNFENLDDFIQEKNTLDEDVFKHCHNQPITKKTVSNQK